MTDPSSRDYRHLGYVEVDSGTLVIGDPLYLLPRAKGAQPGVDYQAVLDADDRVAQPLADRPVLLLTGFGGDGTFPVVGEFEDEELVRVVVVFEEPDEDEE